MRIPSPDDVLIEAAERAARPFQRRGTPVPALRVPLYFLEPAGSLMVGAMFLSILASPEGRLIGLAFVLMAAVEGVRAGVRRRSLSRDARAWGPDLARRYRAAALSARESARINRLVALLMAVGCLAVATLALRTANPLMVTGGLGFALASLGRLAVEYAKCVFPEDPDLTDRAPVPSGA